MSDKYLSWLCFSLIYSFSTFLIISTGCHRTEPYQFLWDSSVENHSGLSRDLHLSDGKHRGMTAFGWRGGIDSSINILLENNVEWLSMVPYMYQETERTKEVRPREEIGVWTYWDSLYIHVIDKVHERNMHVMLKPHLWMSEGWRSNIEMDSDKEWDLWFNSYRRHVIHYAMMAELLNVELYCIGTEFNSSILKQPDKWDELIDEVKSVYNGQLTFAANWDGEHQNVQFWNKMDYIGIQAYFPLSNHPSPTLPELKKGWKKHKRMLKQLSKKYDKPILFTEVGYRSDASATIEPWIWGEALDSLATQSQETQNLAFESLFQSLWKEDWFAGMYIWQWRNRATENISDAIDFTPQFKQAQNTMAKWYGVEVP